MLIYNGFFVPYKMNDPRDVVQLVEDKCAVYQSKLICEDIKKTFLKVKLTFTNETLEILGTELEVNYVNGEFIRKSMYKKIQ